MITWYSSTCWPPWVCEITWLQPEARHIFWFFPVAAAESLRTVYWSPRTGDTKTFKHSTPLLGLSSGQRRCWDLADLPWPQHWLLVKVPTTHSSSWTREESWNLFFFFLVSGINTFLTSLLFEIYSFDSQTHFQPCIMCSNTALLVYLPHKCCCYCLDVTSSDELAGARNSLLVLALCITSGIRWPPGNWFLVSPCSGNFIRGVSALFDKNRMNFKENASRSSSEQRRDVKANDAEA